MLPLNNKLSLLNKVQFLEKYKNCTKKFKYMSKELRDQVAELLLQVSVKVKVKTSQFNCNENYYVTAKK